MLDQKNEKLISKTRNVSVTFNAEMFAKTQDKINKLQTDLAQIPNPPSSPSDGVKLVKIIKQLVFFNIIFIILLLKE